VRDELLLVEQDFAQVRTTYDSLTCFQFW